MECVDVSGITSLCVHVLTAVSPSPSTLNLLKWKDEQGREQTFRLVNRVSAKWEDFGLVLGLDINQLEVWRQESLGSVSVCWNRVMDHWLRGGSAQYPPTWEGLYTLLNDMEYVRDAKELRKAVTASGASP